MNPNIQLEPKHFSIVKTLLQKHRISAYVFGSRAKTKAKTFSDLDLCVKESYSKSTIRMFQDDLESSDLPFKVDLVVWSELSPEFKSHIENDLVLFE